MMSDMTVNPNDIMCLRWNDFEGTISQAFQKLRTTGDFCDVTLACEEKYIEAHRTILSTCSPIFHNILKLKSNSQPIIFMRGVTHKILMAIMDFMYKGEVSISQDSLAAFLDVGEDLKIKGLTEVKQAEEQVEQVEKTFLEDTRNIKEVFNWNIKKEITEKLESKETGNIGEGDCSIGQENPIQGKEGLAPPGSGKKNPRNWLTKFIGRNIDSKSHCTICGKVKKTKMKVVDQIDHIENCHFPGMFVYSCDLCGQVKQSRTALKTHKKTYHSQTKKLMPTFVTIEEEAQEVKPCLEKEQKTSHFASTHSPQQETMEG